MWPAGRKSFSSWDGWQLACIYGYYLKCDRTYEACETPRALLRGQVELVDLTQMRYVGGYGFTMNVPVPLDQGTDGAASPEAMKLIDAHLQTLSLEIQAFLKAKGLLDEKAERSI